MGQNESTMEKKQDFGEADKIFIGGLNLSTTDDSLQAYFSGFGKVLDSVVMKYPSGKSRGFGFVTFSTPKEAKHALSKKHTLDGKSIDVRKFDRNEYGKKSEKKEDKFKVFLGGLPPEVSPEKLTLFFERFGKVSEVIIPADKVTKKQKGFGFVCFETEASAQKCLSCEFVHFGGRKIQLRAAEPRSNSKSGEVNEGCNTTEVTELSSFKEKNSLCTSEDYCSSVASKETIVKEESDINKMLADYFTKIAATFSDLNNMNTTEKDGEDNNGDDGKNLLKEFLIQLDNKNQTLGKNLIEFSDSAESESESESEERKSSVDPNSSDDDCNRNAKDFTDETELIRLLSELVTPGRDSLLCSSENLGKENCGGKCDKKTAPSAPLKFIGNQGSLFCYLCEWTSEDNDSESFLRHCKTASHRLKLKGRFSKNDNQTMKAEECGPVGKGGEEAYRKPLVMIEGHCSKQLSETLETKSKEMGGNQKPLKRIRKRKKVKQGNVKMANTTEVPKEVNSKQANSERQAKELKKLKVRALAKGMSCIQALPDGRLKCIMCEKMIPESMDFSSLMKNTTCHLQSKTHLEKLLKTEDSLKNLSEESLEKSQNPNNAEHPPSICNNTKKKTAKQKVDQNSKKQSIPQKSTNRKYQKTVPKSLMLCIPCNFYNSKIEVFASHLESSSHFNCFTSKNLKTDISLNNMTKCIYCNVFLYGSLLCINTHCKNCSIKKNKTHEHLKS